MKNRPIPTTNQLFTKVYQTFVTTNFLILQYIEVIFKYFYDAVYTLGTKTESYD